MILSARKLARRELLKSGTMLTLGAVLGRGGAFVLPTSENKHAFSFENVTSTSGVKFVLDNGAQPKKYQPETMTGGVAVFDYDNDGLLDLYFCNGAHLPDMNKSDPRFHNRLYRNNGDGTFTDVTEQAGVAGSRYTVGVAVADYDNFGFQDFLITGANGYQLFHNNGKGTFTDVTAHAGLGRVHPDLANAFSAAAGWFD